MTVEREVAQRVWRSWVEDGLPELVTGLGFLALAVVLWGRGHVVGRWAFGLKYIQVGVVLALAFGARRLVQAAKWRVTYPRTGYVAYSRNVWRNKERWMIAAAGLVIAAGFAFVIMAAKSLSASASLMGLSATMAAIFLFMAGRWGWRRGFLYAAMAALAAPLAVMLSAGGTAGRTFALQGGVHFAIVGVAQIAGGAWALSSYLRKYPLPLALRRKSHE